MWTESSESLIISLFGKIAHEYTRQASSRHSLANNSTTEVTLQHLHSTVLCTHADTHSFVWWWFKANTTWWACRERERRKNVWYRNLTTTNILGVICGYVCVWKMKFSTNKKLYGIFGFNSIPLNLFTELKPLTVIFRLRSVRFFPFFFLFSFGWFNFF